MRRRIFVRARHLVALMAILGLAGCATLGGASPDGSGDVVTGAELEAALAELREAEELYSAGRYAEAATRADSLYEVSRRLRRLAPVAERALWLEGRALDADGRLDEAADAFVELLERLDQGGIYEQAVLRLAAIRQRTGDPSGALELLLEQPEVVGQTELETMRDAVVELERRELARLARRFPARGPAASVLHAELARVLILADRVDSAHRVARRVLSADPDEPERRIASVILDAGEGIGAGPLRIGAVLPLSGRFAGVGELLREGIELALEAHTGDGLQVEIVYKDDGSDPELAVELVLELEREGALAVVGPLRSESLAGAGRQRRNERLLIVSPTATEVLEPARNTYTLWDAERRQTDAARRSSAWLAGEVGLRRGAILYPVGATGRAAAEAFRRGLEESGGSLVAAASYDPANTTFDGPVSTVAEARPDFVYVAGASVPTVLTLAPQLAYYGINRSVIAGDPTWSEPSVVRRLDPTAADYRIVSLYVDRTSPGTPWQAFRNAYEGRYRKSLDNMLPALAYDAASLVLRALREVRLPLPSAVAAFVGRSGEVDAVTGRIAPDAISSTVERRPLVRMLLDRQLVNPDRSRVLVWLEDTRARADSLERAEADGRRP
jgi:branched-chain amino acid transport system substrate-binding protein